MGADITFYKGQDESYYFRDAYNLTNLAQVIGKSYWKISKKGKNDYIKFFNELAKISDKQIKTKVKFYFTKKRKEIAKDGGEEEWIKMFKEKRDDIKAHLDLINNADRVSWSV